MREEFTVSNRLYVDTDAIMQNEHSYLDSAIDESLSIVMQGPVLEQNRIISSKIVENIIITRCQYPKAEFIISTWELDEKNRSKLDLLADKYSLLIVYNKDPGLIFSHDKVVSSNINRMIVSTKNGMKAVTRSLVIKLRTDSKLYNNSLGNILQHILQSKINKSRQKEFKIFENYVVNCNLFARDAKGYLPYLFHPGDICLAGTKEDLILLFDVPLADECVFENISRACFLSFMKYVPEQYIWVQCIANRINKIIYLGNKHYNKSLVDLSEKYFINNFVALAPSQIGFNWPKHHSVYKGKGIYSIYSLNDWKILYNKYNRGYFLANKKEIYLKIFVTMFTTMYFFVRTSILRVPLLRRLAIKYFRKRG